MENPGCVIAALHYSTCTFQLQNSNYNDSIGNMCCDYSGFSVGGDGDGGRESGCSYRLSVAEIQGKSQL